MAKARDSARSSGKSDPIDALAVVRAARREPDLPVARLDGPARELRLLVDHREDLVRDRTGHINRLRWHFHELDPTWDPPARSMTRYKTLDAIAERLNDFDGMVARMPADQALLLCLNCRSTRCRRASNHPAPGDAMDELYWDPFDVDIDTDPYETWRRMRDEAPAYRNDRFDFWALSRFADVEAAHRDPKTFSSSHGTVLELMADERVPAAMMIFLDPPDHTQLRALVSRAFTPRRVAHLEGRIRELCDQFLAPWVDGQAFDYVQGFGARLPAMVIASLLGVPASDQAEVRRLIDTMFHLDPDKGMVNDVSLTAQIELHEYLTRQIEDRRARPRDDMLTDLVNAELTDDQGAVRRLTVDEAANFGNLLISAGTETVARLLGWSAVVLDQHPDQRAALAVVPSLIPNAVEELLRYEAPSPVQGRWLAADVALHGHTIPAGSKVLLLTGSAGRDERKYPEAHVFDIHRNFDHHVSFGYGIHFCLGASLARLEGRVALEETLKRHPRWTVDHASAVRLHTSTVRGWTNVPVLAA
jgi:cytochrome P450